MGEKTKIVYSEPADYFPEETRRKYRLGEYSEILSILDIKAVMLGHAVGDALGVPVEFCSREELDAQPVTDMMGWGSYPVPEGCWSDDTSMSLATLDSLKSGKVDYDSIMENFVAWCSRDEYTPTGEMFDIGRTCLTAIRNYLRQDGKSALECGLKDEHSNGNGSLMRIHPAVLFLYNYKDKNKAIEIIHNISSITHAHERSKIACGIYAFLLWELLSGDRRFGDKATIRRGISKARKHYASNPEFEHYAYRLCRQIADIDHIWEDPDKYKRAERDDIRSTGYVVDTLEAAVWCLITTNSYKDCVLKAVNLGDDTDTVAAIAGGLAGALYGLDAIPIDWLEKLKKKDYIEKMCEEACNTWQNMI